MGKMIENYNIRNAYVDTSYIKRDGTIVVSNFSSDGGNKQETVVRNILRITANDGYKFDYDDDVDGKNYLPLSKGDLKSYSPYNTNWKISDETIETVINRENHNLNLTLSYDSLSEPISENELITFSGFLKVNNEFPEKHPFIDNKLNTYVSSSQTDLEYNKDTGYFKATYPKRSSWLIHANTTLIKGDKISIYKPKLEKGNKATDWIPAHLEDYYFDVQFQRFNNSLNSPIYNGSLPFIRIYLSKFEPVTDISTYEWLEQNRNYPLYQGVNSDGSMFYTYTVDDTKHLILLYGGLRERDLLFFTFTKQKSESNKVAFSMNGENWVSTELFAIDDYDMVGNPETLNFLNNLNFVAIPSGSLPIEDTSKYLFNTYYINNEDLSILRENSGLVSDVIINTYSYPLNFADEDLVEVDFSVADITQNIPAKRFLKNNTEIEIFKFTIPDIPDVTEIRVRIPFNNDVVLNYEDVRGKTITGRFVYEILTNSTTLFINDGTMDIYKVLAGIGVSVPYKPTGNYDGGNDPVTRLSVDNPKLFIKGVGKSIKGNYIRGSIINVVKNMLNSERDKLNSLLRDGVYFND